MGAEALRSDAFMELRFAADPAVAPGGRSAVLTVSEVVPAEGDPEDDDHTPPRYRSRLWRADVDAGTLEPFTQTRWSDTAPAWAPDGSAVAFLRRDGADARPQLWVVPAAGGEARPLTGSEEIPAGVERFTWLPGGGDLLILHRGGWRDAAARSALPRRIVRGGFRVDGRGFLPDAPAVIERIGLAGGRERLAELPFDPLGWHVAPAGDGLYWLAPRSEEERRERRAMLTRLDLAAGATHDLLVEAAGFHTVAPSPDGAWIALVGPGENDRLGTPDGLWIVPAAGSGGGATPRLVGADADVTPSPAGDSRFGANRYRPCWEEPQSDAVIVAVGARGRAHVARMFRGNGELDLLTRGDLVVTGFDVRGGHAWFVSEAPDRPAEVFVRNLGEGGDAQQVGDLNGAFRERYRLAPAPEERTCRADDGPEVAYWVLEPPAPRADRALVLQVHGGPHTSYGYGFVFEFQLLAARGYAVAYGNPRGSASYGAEFANAILGRYGTVDAADVLAIADAALAGHADPHAPMHLTGGSYGGFMTNWLLGETERFASAVTQRSICNWLSFYGSSDIGPYFAEREVRGRPWSDTETLWRQSPLARADRIVTPLLVVHAEEDWRCPLEQGVQLFGALEHLGREVELLLVPGDGHELSRSGRPDRRVARLDAILDWFERHPGGDAGGSATAG